MRGEATAESRFRRVASLYPANRFRQSASDPGEAMAREQATMAAGGIVLRREQPPLVAVVRLRKRDEWVLPKGKLDDGETPRDAAKREVLEETGHNVTVHEFLGTLVLDTGTRCKIVHYWRMEAASEQTRPLMDDIRAVDWLPLDDAVARLSRGHEKTFLENVGPYALAGLIRRTKAKPASEEKVAATDKFAPAIRAAAARAAAAGKPVANEPAAQEPVAAEPVVKETAVAKPAATRKRRSRAPEPAEPVVAPEMVPEPVEAAVPTPAEAAPVERAPIVAETLDPPADVAPVLVEIPDVPGHVAAEPPADAIAESAAEPVAEPASPEEAEPAMAEASDQALELAPADSMDVERVRAVAAKIKSMTDEAALRRTQAREQGEAAQDVVTVSELGAQPTTSDMRDLTAPEAAAEMRDTPGGEAGPQKRSLAQKVRGWFGRAA
jgi:8-oxo-dGTP diphosphatase